MFENYKKRKEMKEAEKDVAFLMDYVEQIKEVTDKYKEVGFGDNTNLIYSSLVGYFKDIKELYKKFASDFQERKGEYIDSFDGSTNFTRLEKNCLSNIEENNFENFDILRNLFAGFTMDGTTYECQKGGISSLTIYLGGDYSMRWDTNIEYSTIENWKNNKESYKRCEKYLESIAGNKELEEKYSFCETKADFIAQYYGIIDLDYARSLGEKCDILLKAYNNEHTKDNKDKRKIK